MWWTIFNAQYFSLQAKFLDGTLIEDTFKRKMGDPAQWRASAQNAAGFRHWLRGDIYAALRAFQRSLRTDTEKIPEFVLASKLMVS
jgi:hypothetical protein